MKLIFYHYVHCPFCIRVRMLLGYFQLSYQSVVVPYNDEKTPISLTGKKMLPIMLINNQAMDESLQIMAAVDKNNAFNISALENDSRFLHFNKILTKLGENIHNLAMPYWIWTPEFNETSRAYFQSKKEIKRGPFKELVHNQAQYIFDIQKDFEELIKDLKPFYQSNKFTVYDILLAAHLWGLYVVPEFQFPEKLHTYLQSVKKICSFNYHQDFWS